VSLRRTFVLAFAMVAAVVAALVGAASYLATTHNLNSQVDESLAAAAESVAAGGSAGILPALPPPGFPDGDHGRGRGGPGGRLVVQSVQRLAADATPTPLVGAVLPVDDGDRALAAGKQAGLTRLHEVVIGPDTYRALTLSTGSGAVMVGRDIDELDAITARLAVQVGGIGLGVVAAAAAAGWLLSRRITRRLERLTEAAEEVGATGRLDVAMPEPGHDEVGRLTATLDAMLGELARSRDDQRRLVQDAGHELRTPLTSLRTNVSVMRRFTELSPESQRGLLDDVEGETRELTSLVNELVELATDRRAEEAPEPVELAELAERAAERARRRSGRTVVVHAAAVTVTGRRGALERAVGNLLDNAAKFDPGTDTPIELHADRSCIEVRDRGPGIALADAPHVFDRFFRATTARSFPGSGLGLAIVNEIAVLHGGHGYAQARDGGGAVIGFTLGSGSHAPVQPQTGQSA
jgi:two-component system sensor histidine kinase MprB